jgi:thioredoxin-related protein
VALNLSEKEELELLQLRKQKAQSSQKEAKEPSFSEQARDVKYGLGYGLAKGALSAPGETEKFFRYTAPEFLGLREESDGRTFLPTTEDIEKGARYLGLPKPKAETAEAVGEYGPAVVGGVSGLYKLGRAGLRGLAGTDIGQLLLGKKTEAQRAALQKEAQALGGAGKQALTAEEAAQQQRLAAAGVEKQRGVTEAVSRGLSETATQEQLAEIAKKAGLKAETQSALGLRELPGVRTIAEAGQFKPVPMTPTEIGNYIRDQAKKFLSAVKDQRNAAADKNFGAAKDAAKKAEALGQFVDTKPIVAQLDSLLAKGGTSDYLRSIEQLKKDVENTKSFEGLEIIRRRLGDAAYGAPEEGYKAIGQQFSGDMYKALSDQMKGYSKDFSKYLDDYKRLSKTIEAYGTKVGKGITETQDTAGKYYAKTAEQITKDIFSSPEKYRMFVDAVGGNKQVAEAAARRYFAGLAEKTKTPEKIRELIGDNRALLEEFPFVRKEIESRYLAPLVKAETRAGAASSRVKQTEEAKKIARKEHKYILLNFSGSDWCGPCIRFHKEILENETFQTYASKNLVMVNVDFPRLKKNQLPAAQQKINDGIAERYNSQGIFPLTVLLTENGKILKQWEGYPKVTTSQFVDEIKGVIDHAQ